MSPADTLATVILWGLAGWVLLPPLLAVIEIHFDVRRDRRYAEAEARRDAALQLERDAKYEVFCREVESYLAECAAGDRCPHPFTLKPLVRQALDLPSRRVGPITAWSALDSFTQPDWPGPHTRLDNDPKGAAEALVRYLQMDDPLRTTAAGGTLRTADPLDLAPPRPAPEIHVWQYRLGRRVRFALRAIGWLLVFTAAIGILGGIAGLAMSGVPTIPAHPWATAAVASALAAAVAWVVFNAWRNRFQLDAPRERIEPKL
jgi:hypothetical protein